MAELELERAKCLRRLGDLRAKYDRGERLDADELRESITLQGFELWHSILEGMAAKRSDPERRNPVIYTQGTAAGIRLALFKLLTQIGADQIVSAESRRALEDRIARLDKDTAKLEKLARISLRSSNTSIRRLDARIAVLEAAPKPRQRVKTAARRS